VYDNREAKTKERKKDIIKHYRLFNIFIRLLRLWCKKKTEKREKKTTTMKKAFVH